MLHDRFQPGDSLSHRQGSVLSPLVRTDELQQLAKQSLQKLSHLQKIADQTSAELRSLESLIRSTFGLEGPFNGG
jgi:hypothetical protein